jgi:hypothetical protein
MEVSALVYMDNMLKYAAALLGSLDKIGYHSTLVVGSMSPENTQTLRKAFPHTNIDAINYPFVTKDLYYNKFYAYKALRTQERAILVDVDTMFLSRIDDYFDHDFDIGYTFRTTQDEGYPMLLVNTGVILVKSVARTKPFFEKWEKDTRAIREKRRPLKDYCTPYRACGEQEALVEMLGGKREFEKTIKNHLADRVPIVHEVDGIKLRGFYCQELNCISRVPTPETRVIHFKGIGKIGDKHWSQDIRTMFTNTYERYL